MQQLSGTSGRPGLPGSPRVTVVGSLNTDISLAVPHLPGPGETVLSAAGAVVGAGGKGANQAVAAARLGAAVRMVGCCGDDEFGARLRAGLAAEGVDAGAVRMIAGAASGMALITVDAAGENAIAVAAGANGLAGEEEVAAAFAAPCEAVVASAEIPLEVLAGVLGRAREAGATCVLNLAPAPDGAARLLAGGVDWLVVNEQEAAAVLGRPAAGAADQPDTPDGPGPPDTPNTPDGPGPPDTPDIPDTPGPPDGPGIPDGPGPPDGPDSARAAASGLVRMGARHAVITLGAAGAVLARAPDAAGADPARAPDSPVTVAVPGFSVVSVDSVGAGDAFVAALAVALAAGVEPVAAVRAACAVGAAAVTRRGAQAALPRPADVLAATGMPWPVPGR